MKKLSKYIIIAMLIIPFNLRAQNNNDAISGAAAGIVAIGTAVAAIDQLKENLEQKHHSMG